MGRWSSAYFDRENNAWTVGRHDTSRAGRADSYSTYPDRETAERVATEENAEEKRHADARRTITHNETVQALKDVEEYRRRFPGQPFNYNWFVVQFNTMIDRAKGPWEWKIYEDVAKAALDAANKPATKTAPKKARKARAR